jgi:hypothetical protein
MIISASYRTDIPTFYGEWFRNRLRAGFCKTVNPFNRNQRRTVSLLRKNVDGFVFWTKNLAPFMDVLREVHDGGFPFIVQYTINGYPRALESRVVDASRSVQTFRAVAERFGPRIAVWRYDTIILSTLTGADFHRGNFARLAEALAGATDEVVVSFMQLYDKTRTNMDDAARREGFEWEDPPPDAKRVLLRDLAAIAADHRMRLTICTQPELLSEGIGESRCIDADRLIDSAGQSFRAALKGMRRGCGCFESRDIGDYDTCPHGCQYCYAVRSRPLALRRYADHDPAGEYLYPHQEPEPTAQRKGQLPMFPDEDG